MKTILTLTAILFSILTTTVFADTVPYGEQCSYGAPISNVYKDIDNKWIIQVYGGSSVANGSDIKVEESQLVFKGLGKVKSLTGFKIGWLVEDKGFGGRGNTFGQCDMTKQFLETFGQEVNKVYIIKG